MTPESKERLWRAFKDIYLPTKGRLLVSDLHDDRNKLIFESEFIEFIQWFELRQAKRRLMKAIFKVFHIKQISDFVSRVLKL